MKSHENPAVHLIAGFCIIAVFVLEDTGQYVNLRLVEFVNDKKRRTAG